MTKQSYQVGKWKIQCDICGETHRNTEMKKQWDNLIVCQKCYSPKHPFYYPRPIINDGLPVPEARPRPLTENMITVPFGTGGSTICTDLTLICNSTTWICGDVGSEVSQDSLLMQNPALDTGPNT